MRSQHILFMLVFILAIGMVQPSYAWLDGWNYRVGFNLSLAGIENYTAYQVPITVSFNSSRTNGTDIRVTMNGTTEMNVSFYRQNFTAGNDVTQNYSTNWNYTNASGIIWVNASLIPNGTNTTEVFFYYNASSSDESNGGATFPIFDVFGAASINTSIWSARGQESATCGGGFCNISSASDNDDYFTAGGYRNLSPGKEILGSLRSSITSGSGIDSFFGFGDDACGAVGASGAGHQGAGSWRDGGGFNGYQYRTKGPDTTSLVAEDNNNIANFANITITWYPNSSVNWTMRGPSTTVQTFFYTPTNRIPNGTNLSLMLGGKCNGWSTNRLDIDWIAVRNFSSPEPTVSAQSAEESEPPEPPTIVIRQNGDVTNFTDSTINWTLTVFVYNNHTSALNISINVSSLFTSGLYNMSVVNGGSNSTNFTSQFTRANVSTGGVDAYINVSAATITSNASGTSNALTLINPVDPPTKFSNPARTGGITDCSKVSIINSTQNIGRGIMNFTGIGTVDIYSRIYNFSSVVKYAGCIIRIFSSQGGRLG